MPPPQNGNAYTPFATLIALRQLSALRFQSIALPFAPGGQVEGALDRAYGGHVYAQAAWAACQTVSEGFLLHHISGNFLLGGLPRVPFVYSVQKIRDGKGYCTRIVHVTQGDETGKGQISLHGDEHSLPTLPICFTSTISFKTAEESYLDLQERGDLWRRFAKSLRGRKPTDFEEVPGMDVPWYWARRAATGENDEFPGLESRKVDMRSYNRARHPFDRRGLIFYRTLGAITPADNPNLHLIAHVYASDRNSLYIVANHLDVGDVYTQMSSLVHQVIFHSQLSALQFRPSLDSETGPMDDSSESGRWFCKEDWTNRAGSGRVMFHSRVWAPDGSHVASMTQDGLIRYTKKAEATGEEMEELRRRQRNWKIRERL